MDEALIRELATNFRRALEGIDRQTLPIQFRDFPRGSCGDTSLLLGTYLQERGLGEFTYIVGWRGEWPQRVSHGWIERGGLIVDVTADQFGDGQAVIVTSHSDFHLSFESAPSHVANFRHSSYLAATELAGLYHQIEARLEEMS